MEWDIQVFLTGYDKLSFLQATLPFLLPSLPPSPLSSSDPYHII